jgi:hypothetical protein
MALKRRSIEDRMPPEVRRRADKGGGPKANWYAGREQSPETRVQSTLEETPPEVRDELAKVAPPPQPGEDERETVISRVQAWVRRHAPHRRPATR